MTLRVLLISLSFLFLNGIYAQSYWNDASMWEDGIPDANDNITINSGVVIVPSGYTAECKDLEVHASSLLSDNTEIIIEGTLIVNDDIEFESDILLGVVQKPVKITVAEGGRLVIDDDFKIKGDDFLLALLGNGDKEIVVNGTLDVYDKLELENDDDSDASGLTITVGENGVINLFKTNSNSLVDIEGGEITFGSNARVNFASTSGDQRIKNWMTFPDIGITGGNEVELKEDIDASAFAGDILIENGVFDLAKKEIEGNQSSNIIVGANGTLRIGDEDNFPSIGNGANDFASIDLQKGSTVEYDYNNDQNVEGLDYWNLTVEKGDEKTLVEKASVSGVLTIDNNTDLNVEDYSLTIVSTGDGVDETGMIGEVDGDIIGDSVIVQRYIDLTTSPNNLNGWNDWSTPVIGTSLESWKNAGVRFSGFEGSNYPTFSFNSTYFYDASTITTNKNTGWVTASNVTNGIELGRGVRTYDGNVIISLADTGSVHVGDLEIDLDYKDIGDTQEEGWNLLGNPYACPIDWVELFDEGVSGDVANAFWLYSNATGYYTYNGATGVGTGLYKVQDDPLSSGLIPSHKAFWVKANEAGTSIEFKEEMKNTGGVEFLKNNNSSNQEILRIQIESDVNNYKSAAVLVFDDRSKKTFDAYDAAYFKSSLAAAPGIAFKTFDNKTVSINTMPKGPDFKEVFLYTKVGKNGTYRLRFYDLEKFGTNNCVRLFDTETGESYNIRETPVINVDMKTTTDENRFKLVVGSPLQAEKLQDVTCFGMNDGQVLISWLSAPTNYYDVYQNDELLYENLQQSVFIKDVTGGTFRAVPVDDQNICEGAFYEVTVFEPKVVIAGLQAPNEAVINDGVGTNVTFYNTSAGAHNFTWDFGDNEISYEAVPRHLYTQPGNYEVRLIAGNDNATCNDTLFHNITISQTNTSIANVFKENDNYSILTFKNGYDVYWQTEVEEPLQVSVVSSTGQLVYDKQQNVNAGSSIRINSNKWSKGVYILRIQVGDKTYSEKLLK